MLAPPIFFAFAVMRGAHSVIDARARRYFAVIFADVIYFSRRHFAMRMRAAMSLLIDFAAPFSPLEQQSARRWRKRRARRVLLLKMCARFHCSPLSRWRCDAAIVA